MLKVKEIVDALKIFEAQEKDGFIEINLPIILDMNNQCFVINITPDKGGFVVSDGGFAFENFNDTAKHYFDMFASAFAEKCEGFEVCGEQVCKRYADNTSLIFALNEFIRFFIEFDNFIFQNHLR